MKEIEDMLDDVPATYYKDITPRELLRFAKMILLSLAMIFILGAISELIKPGSGIFDECKNVLPNMVTFVIAFYFGKSK